MLLIFQFVLLVPFVELNVVGTFSQILKVLFECAKSNSFIHITKKMSTVPKYYDYFWF